MKEVTAAGCLGTALCGFLMPSGFVRRGSLAGMSHSWSELRSSGLFKTLSLSLSVLAVAWYSVATTTTATVGYGSCGPQMAWWPSLLVGRRS